MNRYVLVGVALAALVQSSPSHAQYDSLIARHAAANGLPEALVRRVMMKESGGRAGVVSAGNYGLMQIRLGTARGLGYRGSAAGLLDPETNMTYAARYLAGAYKVAGGNHDRAIALYQRGYYYEAKRQGLAPNARQAPKAAVAQWPSWQPNWATPGASPTSASRQRSTWQAAAWTWPWKQPKPAKRSSSARLQRDAKM